MKRQKQANILLAGTVGAAMFALMVCAALCSFVYTVLSLEIWLSSFSQDAYVHVLVWSVMTFATVWLARKCLLILKRAGREGSHLRVRK